MEVNDFFEIQFNLQIPFTLHRVRNTHIQTRTEFAHDLVEIVAVDLDKAPVFELDRRRCRLAKQVSHHANDQWQLFFLYCVANFNVICNLNPWWSVSSYPILQTISH